MLSRRSSLEIDGDFDASDAAETLNGDVERQESVDESHHSGTAKPQFVVKSETRWVKVQESRAASRKEK